jgi:hypothetical protein
MREVYALFFIDSIGRTSESPLPCQEGRLFLECEEMPIPSGGWSEKPEEGGRLSGQTVAKRKRHRSGPVLAGGLVEDVRQVMGYRLLAES